MEYGKVPGEAGWGWQSGRDLCLKPSEGPSDADLRTPGRMASLVQPKVACASIAPFPKVLAASPLGGSLLAALLMALESD